METRRFGPEDRDLDDELLRGLAPEMDMRALLPRTDVEVGDEWDIELERLPDLLSPGGYLAWDVELDGERVLLSKQLDPVLMGELREVLASMLSGEAVVEYVGDDDGRAWLEFTIDVEGEEDVDCLGELTTRILREFEYLQDIEVTYFDLAIDMEVAGTAVWDSERGRVSEVVIEGELEVGVDLELCIRDGAGFCLGIVSEASGTFAQRFETR